MASSSSSSPSVPTISPRSWTYHVFLSFRGEDTREKFVGHLYTALENMGIHTFKDDKKLSLGKSINPSLIKAIKESQIAIIVFSENYANSSWCLNELVCIMECKKETGLIVVPIFYDVEPSEVRKQKRKYGEAFAKYESEKNANFASWKKALLEACEFSGQDFNNKANMDESELIKDIVNKISKMIRPLTRRVNDNLIGLEDRMRDLISKLQIGSDDVRMIGIWGVGGGGKTTLASSVYREISWEFDGCCLAENIREKSSKNGLEKMQEQILSGVLKQDILQVGSVVEGKDMIMDRLCCKKVLIVLDDVDRHDQLKALAGSHDWFGKGSRIIITTRNQHLLTAHKVSVIHNISLLNNHEAIKLFCKHAPRDNRPVKDYEHLSKEVVAYAGGLPLALTVLGSFLCDSDIDEWRSALARLKEIPNDDIVGKLKISFDGLTKVEKDLFLDIACFHRGGNKDYAMDILDACGFHPVIGVKVLTQRALITISEDGRFDMHDLVQEMGHHIVTGEHPNNPEKHSRVWKEEDIQKIFAMDATTELDMIEAIRHENLSEDLSQHFSRIVANMKNLRWISWGGDFPSLFPPRGLCFLRFDRSSQKQLWEGCKLLPNLKTIVLNSLYNLIMTPDFNGLPNLERVFLIECVCLEEIHPSIGRLERRVFLSIYGCLSLKEFPPIAGLRKLETLAFCSCCRPFMLSETQQQTLDDLHLYLGYGGKEVASSLKLYEIQEENLKNSPHHGLDNSDKEVGSFEISEVQEENMENLPHLDLDNSGGEVASYIESNTNSSVTCWRCGCSNLPGVECCLEDPSLPHNNMKPCLRDNNINHTRLHFFFKDLRNLYFKGCNLGDVDIGSAVWELPNLKTLDLAENKFSRLSFNHLRLPQLKWLDVSFCEELVELSELPSSIVVVKADHCTSLESFGDISNCKWLWNISLWGNNKLGGDILLDSMLQGNAIEDYFISVHLEHQIPKGFAGRLFRGGGELALCLPDDWYNDFCGFSVCVVTRFSILPVDIVMKQEVDEDSLFESNEAVEPECVDKLRTYVGYVSFGSLRHTKFSYSSFTVISVSVGPNYRNLYSGERYVGVDLVPRKSRGDEPQTTKVPIDSSEFWDGDPHNRRSPFTIQHDSKSSIKIKWKPILSWP